MRVMTLGQAPLALRQHHFGVGALEQRSIMQGPAGVFIVLATLTGLIVGGYVFYERYIE